jgi:hypothetical protein
VNVRTIVSDVWHEWLGQPVLRLIAIQYVLIGAAFWIESSLRGDAFSADVFGRFATSFRAELWAASMMAGGGLTYIGLIHPPNRGMVAFGSAISLGQFLALAYSAIHTGGELVIGLYASTMLAPLSLITLWKALHGPDHPSS